MTVRVQTISHNGIVSEDMFFDQSILRNSLIKEFCSKDNITWKISFYVYYWCLFGGNQEYVVRE